MDETERIAWAGLNRVVEPGDERAGELIAEEGPVEALARLNAARRSLGLDPPDGARELAHAALIGARFICPGTGEWPSQLDDLGPIRPTGLWVRGAASLRLLALRSVAVVGARACTGYGARAAAELSAGLAERGWLVVSGGATGIDAAAHRGALVSGGMTVSVLACGVDQAYPRSNEQLLRRIAELGLVVSELPLGVHPNRPRFLQRNRLIAALTRGTAVVEAARRSGSLNTARWAGELNRCVMGVPGPVSSELSSGVHELIRCGAVLVTSAAEVVELVGRLGTDLAPAPESPVLPRDVLGPVALRVVEALPLDRRGVTVERLVRQLALPPATVLARLHELCALGMVAREGTHWRLNPERIATP